ncbi:MAG: DUF4258 domain-containing protein [Prevotella sp.]|nr:DUF4258 domain-containing protein [Prevotella sp.]
MTSHAIIQAKDRGFTIKDIKEIMKYGNRTIGRSKYGTEQYRYSYMGNTVIQNKNDKKIITVFSIRKATNSNVKGYKIPWR